MGSAKRWIEKEFDHFTYCSDLASLIHMIKVMSLNLSELARRRLAWVDAYRECGNAAQVCRHFSIPLRTFWRWKRRYDPWDLKSLENRSRRPMRSPRRTRILIERRILALKSEHLRWGKEKIALFLRKNGIPVSGPTVGWLREQGVEHVFSHKKRPIENAYVERSHRIDEEEFYSVGPLGVTLDDLRRRAQEYLIMYSHLTYFPYMVGWSDAQKYGKERADDLYSIIRSQAFCGSRPKPGFKGAQTWKISGNVLTA